MKLASKIHLYSSVVFAVLLIVMNISVYWLFSRMSLDSQLDQTEAQAATIAERMRQSAGDLPVPDLLRAYVPVDGMLRLVRPDGGEGQPVAMSSVTSSSEQALSQLEASYSSERLAYTIRQGPSLYAHASIPVIWEGGEVVNIQLTESLRPTVEQLNVLRLVLVVVTVIALVPVVLSSRLLAGLIMRPITAMTSTMSEIRRSGRFKRLEQDGRSKDELFEMGETFNGMIGLLESNFEKQKRFVADASHELNTPLTVIESYSELLLRRGKERPELIDESLQAIHSEAVRMKGMTEQLLLLAKHEEQWSVVFKAIDLKELAVESAKAVSRAYGREVRAEWPAGPVMVYSDENKLKQLLFIFLDNARKYSDGEIVIRVSASGSERIVAIQDSGIGIPKEDLPKVFDRFYRVDKARSRQDGGAGLGLSLAREIAEAIGAVIALDSEPGIGTTVTITLDAGPEDGE